MRVKLKRFKGLVARGSSSETTIVYLTCIKNKHPKEYNSRMYSLIPPCRVIRRFQYGMPGYGMGSFAVTHHRPGFKKGNVTWRKLNQ